MKDKLRAALLELGIKKGDVLYIPSDITSLAINMRKLYGVRTNDESNEFLHEIIDAINETVGEDGTVLFPIFSWDFNHGKVFDIRNSLGAVGALPNWILKNRNDFSRTQHPMYSFMVWGKDKRYLTEMNNVDCWGAYSPFGYMHRKNAKTLFFDVSVQRGFTFFHYVEESIHVPYRYFKSFKSEYVDLQGNHSERVYTMYVRDLSIESKENLSDSFFDSIGILKQHKVDGLTLKIMNCADAYEVVKDDFINNSGKNMYFFKDYVIDWNGGNTHADEIGY